MADEDDMAGLLTLDPWMHRADVGIRAGAQRTAQAHALVE
jgi:hypothetical protein